MPTECGFWLYEHMDKLHSYPGKVEGLRIKNHQRILDGRVHCTIGRTFLNTEHDLYQMRHKSTIFLVFSKYLIPTHE